MRPHRLAPLILALTLAAPAIAQQPVTATTDAGQTVLLYPDGTWKYKDQAPAPASAPKNYVKSSSATDKLVLNEGKIVINFDSAKWKEDVKPQEPGAHLFTHVSGDGYAKVISERIQVPLESLKHIVLENAKQACPDARVVTEDKRIVNGKEVLCMEMKGTSEGIPFAFLGYYYSGKEGSVQVITFTAESLFDEYRKEFESFLNGFETAK